MATRKRIEATRARHCQTVDGGGETVCRLNQPRMEHLKDIHERGCHEKSGSSWHSAEKRQPTNEAKSKGCLSADGDGFATKDRCLHAHLARRLQIARLA